MEFGRVEYYVSGEWMAPTSSDIMTNINPVTGNQMSKVAMSTAEGINAAVAAAKAAQKECRQVPPANESNCWNPRASL